MKPLKNIFYQGAIPASFISDSIANHSGQTQIGGHSIFLGQIRADIIGEKKVKAIDYTSYESMALEKMHEIREEIFEKFPINCLHVHHSLGRIEAGEICFFVFASSPHRMAAMEACEETVERVKKELPIWGKEIFEDETTQWKVNQ